VRAFVLITCLGLSCASPTPIPASSPTAFAFTRNAAELVLPPSALPSGYSMKSEGSIDASDVAAVVSLDSDRSGEAADFLLKQGMSSSYARSFAHSDSETKWITSLVLVFRDTASARRVVPFLSQYSHERGCAEIAVEARLGDTSSACYGEYLTVREGQSGVRISITTLVFSFANAVSSIRAFDEPRAENGALLGSIAQKQLQSMRSFGTDSFIKGR